MRFYSPFLIFLVHQCINSIIGEAVITGFVTGRGRTRLTQPGLSNPCQAAAEPSSERSRTCRFDISVGLVSKYITTWTASYTTTLRKLSGWLLCSKWEPRCLLPSNRSTPQHMQSLMQWGVPWNTIRPPIAVINMEQLQVPNTTKFLVAYTPKHSWKEGSSYQVRRS